MSRDYENELSCYKCSGTAISRRGVYNSLPPGMSGAATEAGRMSHRTTNRFSQREVARALKAARLAGERPDRVEIDPKTGKIAVILAKSGEAAAEPNEWDDISN